MRESLANDQFEIHPYPSNLRSGWLPPHGSPSLIKFFEAILAAERTDLDPSVADMDEFIKANPVVASLLAAACRQNGTIRAFYKDANEEADGVPIPSIPDKDTLLHAFNALLTVAPQFIDDDLVGLPFSALVVGIDPTQGGSTLFGLPEFNEKMGAILGVWHKFLETYDSNVGFRAEGKDWLSPAAKKQYQFDDWKKDNETLPYWNSWNSFFTRQFKDPTGSRPIADPGSNQTVICPNDGSLFRWDRQVKANDMFWFKDMNYSLADILSSPVPEQQAVIDQYGLVDLFEGGYVFQTYLNPYNFHRWWVPVNGEILFDPISVPGAYFNKLVLPDFGGATTASLPYLAQVNARGLIVFKTEDYGHVCAIPLGMSEVSTIAFDPAMKGGATVCKGEEMGMFNYGGSSFAVIYEKLPGKELFFVDDKGNPLPQRPVLPTNSSSFGEVTNIGSQIGIWVSIPPEG
jgi:phosphatidylserine decarboxylase